MDPAVKKRVKWTRKVAMVLRCFQVLAAVGLLIMSILITGLDMVSGWIMKLAVCCPQNASYQLPTD